MGSATSTLSLSSLQRMTRKSRQRRQGFPSIVQIEVEDLDQSSGSTSSASSELSMHSQGESLPAGCNTNQIWWDDSEFAKGLPTDEEDELVLSKCSW
jgi:hypothetical protein